MTSNLEDLAQQIQKIRKAQGLSREDLASIARVSASFVRDAERDTSSCSFGKLHQLCTALGLKWQLHQGNQITWPTTTVDSSDHPSATANLASRLKQDSP